MFRVTGICVAAASVAAAARAQEPYRVIYPKADRAVAAALTEPAKPAYSGSLRDVIGELAREHHINIIIDEVALTKAGVDLDDEVDYEADNVRERVAQWSVDEAREIDLAMLLRVLLDPYAATYTVEDGLLRVTTHEEVADRTFLRAYDVRPLLDGDTTVKELADGVARLAGSLKSGRPARSGLAAGSIRVNPEMAVVPFRTTLIVTATSDDHERVETALRMMGQVVGQ